MADGPASAATAHEDHTSSPNRGTASKGQVQWRMVDEQHTEAVPGVEHTGAGHKAGSVQGVQDAVESMLMHSKQSRTNAADRINYSFLNKPKPSVGVTQEKMWTWDTIQQLAGLDDTSNEAEAERTELIRRVFTYELMNTNSAYRRYMQGQLDPQAARQSYRDQMNVSYDHSETASTLVKAWRAWQESDIRYNTYMWLSHAEYSRLAWAINILIIAAILVSTTTFCVETIPSIERSSAMVWLTIIDYTCLGIFTVEFLGRLATCPDLPQFLRGPMNILDFFAIFPFYKIIMSQLGGSASASNTRIIRLIRLLRVLRLLRLWTKFQNLTVILDALVSSLDILGMLSFLLLVILIVFSTIIYYIEGGVDGSALNSIPQSMYYIQTTLTTTGYGDVVPMTYQGKFVAGVLMLFAIITLALPISVIGANFTNMWTDFKTMKRAAERSSQVWPNFRALNQALEAHRGVLDDVVLHCKRGQAGIDADVAALREASQRARLLYLMRVTQGQSPGWQADLLELKGVLISMRSRLALAREHWEELEAVMGVGVMTRADDFMLKLDRMHLAYKNLRKWFEEGVYMVQEVRMLTEDITNLKRHLQATETAARVAPAAGGAAAAAALPLAGT